MEVDLLSAVALLAIILLIYHHIAQRYQYFLSKPIPCVKPTFLLGSSGPSLFRRIDPVSLVKKLYNTYPDSKITGFYEFTKPIYILRDPEVIKKIGVKDFDYFPDHTSPLPIEDNDSSELTLFENSLFMLRGQKWRDMRATLSPAFTGSKMRHMFELVSARGKSLAGFFLAEAQAGKRLEVEMKDICSRFGTDVIGTIAFGITVESNRDRENEFYTRGKELLTVGSLKMLVKFLLMRNFPRLMRKLKTDIFDAAVVQYFRSMIADNMKQREVHKIVRNDMIHMLMEVRRNALKHQENQEQDGKDAGFATVEESHVGRATHSRVWTDDELIAQCLLFFFAGFDTISSGMTFMAYELAINPEIQKRLYEEICQVDKSLAGAALSYDVLLAMEYMDMVVSESLRKWPPFIVVDRVCAKDYLYDDGAGRKFLIEKGSTMWILPAAIHSDSRFYSDPEKFDPDRFSKENRSKINVGAYVPFGVGPRNCIGSRLALMQVKSVMYHLLKEFSFEPTEKTQIPMKLAKDAVALQGENGVWVELRPRQQLGK